MKRILISALAVFSLAIAEPDYTLGTPSTMVSDPIDNEFLVDNEVFTSIPENTGILVMK